MYYIYPNWNGELKDLPAGMHGLKDFFRQGKKCYSAEKLTAIASPAFNKKPNLLLNHYKAQSGEHVVLAGETLSKLSERFYGSVKYCPSLLNENFSLIPEGDHKRLQIGTKLSVPKLSEIEVIFKRVGPPPPPKKQVKKKNLQKSKGLQRGMAASNPVPTQAPKQQGANFYIGGGGDNYDIGPQTASKIMEKLSKEGNIPGKNFYFGHEQINTAIAKMNSAPGAHNLIGHSWGGVAAIDIVTALPEGKVKNLITLDPVAMYGRLDPKKYKYWINVYPKQDIVDTIMLFPIVGHIIGGILEAAKKDSKMENLIGTVGGQMGEQDGAINKLAVDKKYKTEFNHGDAKEMLEIALKYMKDNNMPL